MNRTQRFNDGYNPFLEVEPVTEAVKSTIQLNEDQLLGIQTALLGVHCCIHGKAGTGKTTTARELISQLKKKYIDAEQVSYRVQGEGRREFGLPIAVVAFTRAALKPLRNALGDLLTVELTTVHNLLEYAPVETFDEITGEPKRVMKETRNAQNPLQQSVILIDETSMLATDLFNQIREAAPHAQFILMGDINQARPVYGESVLYYALSQWPSVYLNRVYRQALDNPIIAKSLGVIEGKAPSTSLIDSSDPDSTTKAGVAVLKAAEGYGHSIEWQNAYFKKLIVENKYDRKQDKFLSPYNVKTWGVDEINLRIAAIYDELENREVHHIVAGVFNRYYAIGDIVSFMKESWEVTAINPNSSWHQPAIEIYPPSTKLSRKGIHSNVDERNNLAQLGDIDFDNIDIKMVASGEDEKTKELPRQCSHLVHIRNLEDPTWTMVLSTLGEYSDLALDYARTIYKSQGSQWRRVFVIMHKTQTNLRNREMLYTAMTRAQTLCVLISDPNTLRKATKSTFLEGDSIATRLRSLADRYPAYKYELPEHPTGASLSLVTYQRIEDTPAASSADNVPATAAPSASITMPDMREIAARKWRPAQRSN